MILANIAYVRHHNKWNGIRHNFVADPTISTICFNLFLISWHFDEIFNDIQQSSWVLLLKYLTTAHYQLMFVIKNPHFEAEASEPFDIQFYDIANPSQKSVSIWKLKGSLIQKKGYRIFFQLSLIPSGIDKAFNVTFFTRPDARRLLMCGADEEGDLCRIFNKAVPFYLTSSTLPTLTDREDQNSWRHDENSDEPVGYGQTHYEKIRYGP